MEELHTKAIKLAKMGIWEWYPKTNETIWYDNKFELFGYEPHEFDLSLENAFKTVHPDDRDKIFAIIDKKLPTEDYFEYEYRGIKKDLSQMFIWVRVNVERDEQGNPIKVSGISQDISQRKELENNISNLNQELEKKVKTRTLELEQKNIENEILIKEMHHRVKNNLQVVSSILNLQQDHIEDNTAKEILKQSINRIKSIALVHESLYSKSNLEKIELDGYVHQLFGIHSDERQPIEFRVSIDECSLSIHQMVPIGMILNELISNSIKHAFNSKKGEFIELVITNTDKLNIQYQDNGNGFDSLSLNSQETFGLNLIEILCGDLEGEFNFESKKGEGMKFSLSCNINEVIPTQKAPL